MPIHTVVFDLDGTLVDSVPGIQFAVDEALRASGRTITCEVRRFVGPPIRTIFQNMFGWADDLEDMSELEKTYRRVYDSEGWKQTTLMPGALETLAELHKRHMLFIVTNKPYLPAWRICSTLGISGYIGVITSPDRLTPRSPSKAHSLRTVLSDYKREPEETLFVGDTEEDFIAATEIGCNPVMFLGGYGRNLQRLGCTTIETLLTLTLRDSVTPHSSRCDVSSRKHKPNRIDGGS